MNSESKSKSANQTWLFRGSIICRTAAFGTLIGGGITFAANLVALVIPISFINDVTVMEPTYVIFKWLGWYHWLVVGPIIGPGISVRLNITPIIVNAALGLVTGTLVGFFIQYRNRAKGGSHDAL